MSALIDTSTVRKFAVGLDHPEGVAVLSTGEVVAGGEAGQLYLIKLDGTVTEVGSTGGFMLGLCADAEDNVFVADSGNGVVWTWSKNDGLVRFCPSSPDERFRQPNALALSSAGLYLSDSGVWDEANGTIHLLKSDGSSLVVGEEFLRFPNGLAVSPDGAWLYVVESQFGVSRAGIHADGRLGTREVVHPMPDEVPDGLLFDGEGGLLITCYQPNAVFRLTPDGACSLLLHDPQAMLLSMPTNGAWLADGRLLLANLGGWHLSAVAVPFPQSRAKALPFLS
jgi:sugar lactone lactonase YvrE